MIIIPKQQTKRKSSGVRMDDTDLEDPVNRRGAFAVRRNRKDLPLDFTKLTSKQLDKINELASAGLPKHKELMAYCGKIDKQRGAKEQPS